MAERVDFPQLPHRAIITLVGVVFVVNCSFAAIKMESSSSVAFCVKRGRVVCMLCKSGPGCYKAGYQEFEKGVCFVLIAD